jgi:hypothetical protein
MSAFSVGLRFLTGSSTLAVIMIPRHLCCKVHFVYDSEQDIFFVLAKKTPPFP